MKYVAWEVIPGTCLPMMEDENGELFGTNKTVCEGLGINPSTLRYIYNSNKKEFDSLSVGNPNANDSNCVGNPNANDPLSVGNPNANDPLSVSNTDANDSNCVSNWDANAFFRSHKHEFNISRVRSGMRLWTEDDMITFAFFAKSDKGREFRRNLRTFIKANAVRHYVSKQDYDDLKKKVEILSTLVLQNKQAVQYDASLAGKLLSNHRNTKEFRQTH